VNAFRTDRAWGSPEYDSAADAGMFIPRIYLGFLKSPAIGSEESCLLGRREVGTHLNVEDPRLEILRPLR